MHRSSVFGLLAGVCVAGLLVGCSATRESRPTIAPSYIFHQDNPELTVSSVWPVEPQRPVITHVDPDAMPDFGLIENALD